MYSVDTQLPGREGEAKGDQSYKGIYRISATTRRIQLTCPGLPNIAKPRGQLSLGKSCKLM